MADSREPAAVPVDAKPRLDSFGDFRLREDNNFGDRDDHSTERALLRVRAGARYALSDSLTFGTRISVQQSGRLLGGSETVSNLADSTELRLDHAYLRFKQDELTVYAGRFPNPFFRTALQLVWDNSFIPQGAAASYQLISAADDHPGLEVTALHYPLEEWVGRNSALSGLQWVLEQGSDGPHYQLGIGYFDYQLKGEPDLGHEDFRGNVVAPGRGFVSDFKLLDLIGDVVCEPFGERWPLQVVANYVRNLGAAAGAGTAYAADAYLGRLGRSRDWRFNYAYARVETDAVFVAFSHNDITIASNYRWHSLGLEYLLSENVVVSGIWYRYRPEDPREAGSDDPSDWLNRVRFEVNIVF